MTRRLVVVPHTHWDREWYRTHEQFRFRLVSLVDELLDLIERDPDYRHFMLDGQTIVVDDYLEVRPGARARIEKSVREGRIAVGPWHVLPDEWLVSGEALIRNLRIGLARAAALGGGMRVGYVPDQFGHVGQLPQIFSQLGFPAAVLWRGVGDDVGETLFVWEAPDGTRLPTVYLMHGYGNAVNLPTEPAALRARIDAEVATLGKRSRVSALLLMNGSDHERPQPDLPAALRAAQALGAESDPAWCAEIGSLAEFVAQAVAEAPASAPVHRGELRSGLRSPLLPGCASARASQKLREFENDRLLTRYLEPLAAWVGALGGDADPERIEFAWRVALENHPHDSVCGCSIDAVHEQMETRYDRVAEIAGAQLEAVTRALAQHVAAPRAGFGAGAGAPLVVWNPNAGGVL
jgi:alpha-mannosidase